ncbi:hypothetical protein P7C71_g2499, partial [Lecanoromycetidae sp. Uapishka_2]
MQTKRSQPKRKRAEVSYYESSSGESDGEMSEGSDAGPPSKKKPRRNLKVVSNRPLPKKKIFPFMSLPAELKNRIYEIALTDPNGVFFVSKTKHYRRIVEREIYRMDVSSRRQSINRNRWLNRPSQTSQSSASPSADAEPASLVPKILLLNHEIYAQAQPILYASNTYAAEDTMALHAFLANIGTKNRATLSHVVIKGWGYTKAHKALNHPAFTLLADAVNLRRLHIDCRVGWSSGPIGHARQLYRDGFHWLEAFGVAKGQFDAAVGIIEVEDSNLERYYGPTEEKPSKEERLEDFKAELRKLLRSH